MAAANRAADGVFINCPFDADYWPLLEVLVFTSLACGFAPRTALEVIDGGEVRIAKLKRIMGDCRFGIHDISRVQPDPKYHLPRFNMPFELGMDIGCRYFGDGRQRQKKILILDQDQYRYQKYLSDIAGQDIKAHNNNPNRLFHAVRDWLRSSSRRKDIPGDLHIAKWFAEFSAALPELCNDSGLDRNNLAYVDYVMFARDWIDTLYT
ncbi:MAG: hypothetical protein P4L83_06870 [Nevskia sp.]|nr:hypothetical protein [Nevskia sp.]